VKSDQRSVVFVAAVIGNIACCFN